MLEKNILNNMKQYIGKFNAKTDWFTHTEWVKAKEDFGCVVILIAVSVWFLRSI